MNSVFFKDENKKERLFSPFLFLFTALHSLLRSYPDAVAVILSKNCVSKEGYVQKEIKTVLDIMDEKPEGAIFIIPIRLDECEIPYKLQRLQVLDAYSKGSTNKLIDALDARAKEVGKKQSNNARQYGIFEEQIKVDSSSSKPEYQSKKSAEKNKETIRFLNFTALRLISVIMGLLAGVSIRLVCESYYNPGDATLLSSIAEIITYSDFALVLIILIAMVAAGFAYDFLDRNEFEYIGMPLLLRYILSVPIGYISGLVVDILIILLVTFLVTFVLPILLFVAIVAIIVTYYVLR